MPPWRHKHGRFSPRPRDLRGLHGAIGSRRRPTTRRTKTKKAARSRRSRRDRTFVQDKNRPTTTLAAPVGGVRHGIRQRTSGVTPYPTKGLPPPKCEWRPTISRAAQEGAETASGVAGCARSATESRHDRFGRPSGVGRSKVRARSHRRERCDLPGN